MQFYWTALHLLEEDHTTCYAKLSCTTVKQLSETRKSNVTHKYIRDNVEK